jgi:guanylate kinase
MQIHEARSDAVLVFLLPPNLATLAGRLRGRHTDSEEAIERRLQTAVREMKTAPGYDYIVVNDDIDATCHMVESIVAAEQLSARRILSMSSVRADEILTEIGLIAPENNVTHKLEKP